MITPRLLHDYDFTITITIQQFSTILHDYYHYPITPRFHHYHHYPYPAAGGHAATVNAGVLVAAPLQRWSARLQVSQHPNPTLAP